jgi:selenocysteine lyase/cysteine desulfurase
MNFETWRRQFPASAELIHLNNAGQAPTTLVARDALIYWAHRMHEEGSHSFLPMLTAAELARTHLAQFLGAQTEGLAFFSSAASAISQVALGFPLKSKDEILIWDQEYPSNFYPWLIAAQRAKAKLKIVSSPRVGETPVEALASAITPATRVIATSWVQYKAGASMDLQALSALASARGIFTCADIIQGAGVMPFHFQESGLDAACGGSHKWLAAGHGVGYLLLRSQHAELLAPISVGAMTFGMPETPLSASPNLPVGPSRFEPGGKAFQSIIALGESARVFKEVGIESIHAEAMTQSRTLAEGLLEIGMNVVSSQQGPRASPIVNFHPKKQSAEAIQKISFALSGRKISHAVREPGIRLSPHGFNSLEEVDAALTLIRDAH